MTKQEFEEQFCKASEITLEEYLYNFITLPCKCGDKDCKGFAAVCADERSIKNHLDLYI